MTVAELLRAELAAAQEASPAPIRAPNKSHPATWLDTYRKILVGVDIIVATLVGIALMVAIGGADAVVWTPALPIAWVAVAALCGAYRPNVLGSGAHDLRAVYLAGAVLFALVPMVALLDVGITYDITMAAALGAVTLGAGLTRWIARKNINLRRRSGGCTESLLLVGDAAAVVDMVDRLRRKATSVIPVSIAVPTEGVELAARLGLPVVGFDDDIDTLDADKVLAAAREGLADGVLLVPGRGIEPDVLRRLGRVCEWEGLPLLFAPSVVDVATSAVVTPVSGLPVFAMSRPGPSGAGRFGKHVLDRFGALIAVLLLSPLLIVTAIGVRLDSRGPAFFRQVRVGENGAPFTMVKFRTMHVGAEQLLEQLAHLNEDDGNRFKIREDPRVTRLGKVLRKLSVDELPQLFNVLSGSMSLVGPRPPLPNEVEAYTVAERRRLLVKPGMTGLWQVGGRSNLSWSDSVGLDLRYVEAWSLPLDVRIIARTFPEVLRRNGAF